MQRSVTGRLSAPECSRNCAASTVQSEVPACSAWTHCCAQMTQSAVLVAAGSHSGACLQRMPAALCAHRGIRPGGTQSRAPGAIGANCVGHAPLAKICGAIRIWWVVTSLLDSRVVMGCKPALLHRSAGKHHLHLSAGRPQASDTRMQPPSSGPGQQPVHSQSRRRLEQDNS